MLQLFDFELRPYRSNSSIRSGRALAARSGLITNASGLPGCQRGSHSLPLALPGSATRRSPARTTPRGTLRPRRPPGYYDINLLILLAGEKGLEPPTPGFGVAERGFSAYSRAFLYMPKSFKFNILTFWLIPSYSIACLPSAYPVLTERPDRGSPVAVRMYLQEKRRCAYLPVRQG
jgi:hypothetical protein